MTDQIRLNRENVRERIARACAKARREASSVRLIAVTKSVGIEEIIALLRMGIVDLGENRVQRLTQQAQTFEEILSAGELDVPKPRWHMIGNLQRNKIKSVLPWAVMIHSVDRLRTAEEINKRAGELSKRVDVLLEVNGGDEPQKEGAAVCAAPHLGEQLTSLRHLRLRGLMSMAPLTADTEMVRNVFTRVRELYDEMRHDYRVGDSFDTLSMGMSGDFEIAVECGSNMVRIGTALFEGLHPPDEAETPLD